MSWWAWLAPLTLTLTPIPISFTSPIPASSGTSPISSPISASASPLWFDGSYLGLGLVLRVERRQRLVQADRGGDSCDADLLRCEENLVGRLKDIFVSIY